MDIVNVLTQETWFTSIPKYLLHVCGESMQSFKQYITESQINVFSTYEKRGNISNDTIDYITKQYPDAITDKELAKFVVKISSYIHGNDVSITTSDINYHKKIYPKLFQVSKNQKFAYRGLSISIYDVMGRRLLNQILDIIHKKYTTITHESTLHGVKFDGILQNFLHENVKNLQSWTVDENVSWKFATNESDDGYLRSSMKNMINDVLRDLKDVKKMNKVSKRIILDNFFTTVPCILETHIDNSFFMNPELSNTFENSYNESEVIRYSNKPLICNLWIPAKIVQAIKELLDKMDE